MAFWWRRWPAIDKEVLLYLETGDRPSRIAEWSSGEHDTWIPTNPWVTQTLLKESLELNLGKGALPGFKACTDANPTTKEQSCRRGTVGASGASGIEMILVVLGAFSLACGCGTTGLSLEEQIHAEHCHRLKVFLGVLGGSCGRDWTSCIAWCEVPYSEESPKASGLLCPNGSVAGRFCESESLVPSRRRYGVGFGIVKLSFSKRAG